MFAFPYSYHHETGLGCDDLGSAVPVWTESEVGRGTEVDGFEVPGPQILTVASSDTLASI